MNNAFVAPECCSGSGLCMSNPNSLDGLETQHFDERFKRKSSESFLSQPGHTIWVSRHRSLRTQYLHFGVFFFESNI